MRSISTDRLNIYNYLSNQKYAFDQIESSGHFDKLINKADIQSLVFKFLI